MAKALFIIMAFQCLGGLIVTSLGLLFPGPLCGMLLLLTYLMLSGGPEKELNTAGDALVAHLGLLFVPAGVSVISFGDEIIGNLLPLAIAIPVSTALAVAAAGLAASASASGRSVGRAVVEESSQP